MRGNLFEDYQAFYKLLWDGSRISPVLLELCRLRVAALHRCEPELNRDSPAALGSGLQDRMLEVMIAGDYAAHLSEGEAACVSLAEQFVMDPQGITDDMATAAKLEVGDPGLVALLEALAMFDGFCRFQLMLGADPGLQS